MLLFLTFCHTSYAQVDYKDDLNNPLSDSEMGMIHSPLNSCFSNFALADSFSRKHDTINASKFFLQIDPYYFLSQHLTPDSIEKFIADKFKITNHAKDKYKTIFKNAYYAKKSEIYNKLKEMADEDQKIRNRQDSCKDSACYAITGQEMIRTDSIHFEYLDKYIISNGWPSIANGSLYACLIAIHDHVHHEAYIPILKKEVLAGQVDLSVLKLVNYWYLLKKNTIIWMNTSGKTDSVNSM